MTVPLGAGPLIRFGGKGETGARLLPHFAHARYYLEPFFGAGGMFFKLPPGLYQREAVNDLDASIITFFRVLRERPDDLVRALEATPFSRDEFEACLPRSEDPTEEARRVWARSRQSFSGIALRVSNWGRFPAVPGNNNGPWGPRATENILAQLQQYAARLRCVQIDNIDGAEFVDRWAQGDSFVYADPPYVSSARRGDAYAHEMSDADHERLAVSLHAAVERGCRVAISGYPSPLYDRLYSSWRTVRFDVPLRSARSSAGRRRTEVLWCSYSTEHELSSPSTQLSLLETTAP